jgi:RNA polymerase sigma-70 factor (ECF subfamily)
VRTVEDLYRAHARHVLAYALRRTDAATADDVVSEVFLIVERRLADVPADARPWLYGVARRMLANQRRSDGRRAAMQVALGVLARDSAPVPPPELDAGTPLLAALAELRPDDREVLMLTAWEGLGARDAATVLPKSARVTGLKAGVDLVVPTGLKPSRPASTADGHAAPSAATSSTPTVLRAVRLHQALS